MSLVYLDHSKLVTLERVFRSDARRFSEFVQLWQDQGCTLALSIFGVLELVSSDFAESRSARYEMLRHLLPIRTDVLSANVPEYLHSLTGREIYACIGRLFGQATLLSTVDRHWVALPTTIDQPKQLDGIEALEGREFREVLQHFRMAARLYAEAVSRPENLPYERKRFRDIQQVHLPEGDVSGLLDEARGEFDRASSGSALSELDEAERERLVAASFEILRQFAGLMSAQGTKTVLEAVLGVHDKKDHKRFTDELNSRAVFRSVVREVVSIMGKNANPSILPELVSRIGLEDCPGTWLRNAVEIEMRKARPHEQASSLLDLQHLAYLPYVDVFFADSHVADNTRKVLTRKGIPQTLAGMPLPNAGGDRIDAIETVLRSHASK